MNYSSEPIPDSENHPSFRPRRKRSFFPDFSDHTRVDFITQLAHRVEPTFDFFLFALLAGAVISLGFLFNAPAVLVVGALLVPFMAPVIGLSLSAAIGSFRFFIVSLAGLLVGVFLIFLTGLVAGLASPLISAFNLTQYESGIGIRWDLLVAYLFGVVLTTLSLIKSEQTPVLPSAMLSYALLTRVCESGYLLGQGNVELALQAGTQVGWFILAGLLLGGVIFWLFAFRPEHPLPYVYMLAGFAVLFISGWMLLQPTQQKSVSSVFPWMKGIESTTIKAPLAATSTRLVSPSATLTPTDTPTVAASFTTTVSPTITRTPVILPTSKEFIWALVAADGQSGARIREHPSFDAKVVRIVDNDLMVKLLPGEEYRDKVWWSKVKLIDGTIGWMVRSVLSTTTPMPTENMTPTP
jgi:hypothetical protein